MNSELTLLIEIYLLEFQTFDMARMPHWFSSEHEREVQWWEAGQTARVLHDTSSPCIGESHALETYSQHTSLFGIQGNRVKGTHGNNLKSTMYMSDQLEQDIWHER